MARRNVDSPIFVVGAPRSGTSVLTWCLGQHPDILPTEESNWIGDFAIATAVSHAVGSLRGDRSQLSACGLSQDEFLRTFGRAVNSLILSQRNRLLANAERAAMANPGLVHDAIQIARNASDPKRRWVDGTPEYSLQIPALRALFPHARFVHIVRDVRAVVKSLMLFRPDGRELVKTEQEAICYWYRCVQACLAAEQAWGSQVVLRVRYSDLVAKPAVTITRVLDFLSSLAEPVSEACFEPLRVRLNSSRVPPDFDPYDPATDSVLRAEAERLFAELEYQPAKDLSPDPVKAAAQLKLFSERVNFVQTVDAEYAIAQKINAQLAQELEERSNWASSLDREVSAKDMRIAQLQTEIEERTAWATRLDRECSEKDARIATLQREVEERGKWACRLDREVNAKDMRIAQLQAEIEERTVWATRLDHECSEKDAGLAALRKEVEELARRPPIPISGFVAPHESIS